MRGINKWLNDSNNGVNSSASDTSGQITHLEGLKRCYQLMCHVDFVWILIQKTKWKKKIMGTMREA